MPTYILFTTSTSNKHFFEYILCIAVLPEHFLKYRRPLTLPDHSIISYCYTAMLNTCFWLVNCSVLESTINVAMDWVLISNDFNQLFVKWWISYISCHDISGIMFSEWVIAVKWSPLASGSCHLWFTLVVLDQPVGVYFTIMTRSLNTIHKR